MDVISARYHGGPQTPTVIVIHTAEAGPNATARNVANYFATMPDGRQASAHYVVDKNEYIECVAPEYQAWHAPGVNNHSIGIEHTGVDASATTEIWNMNSQLLEKSAELVANLCSQYDIPAIFISGEDVKNGSSGITTHAEITRAFGKSDHWDPGPNFPITTYMELVNSKLNVTVPNNDDAVEVESASPIVLILGLLIVGLLAI